MGRSDPNEGAKSIVAVVLMFMGIALAKTMLEGGCESANRKQLQQMEAENKSWQRAQERKAWDVHVEQARREWNKLAPNK